MAAVVELLVETIGAATVAPAVTGRVAALETATGPATPSAPRDTAATAIRLRIDMVLSPSLPGDRAGRRDDSSRAESSSYAAREIGCKVKAGPGNRSGGLLL